MPCLACLLAYTAAHRIPDPLGGGVSLGHADPRGLGVKVNLSAEMIDRQTADR
jgi:hypothetical protein